MAKSSRHIKQDAIRNIVLKDETCETRMGKIRDLVGLPPGNDVNTELIETGGTGGTGGIGGIGGNENSEVLNVKQDVFDRILEGLSGRESEIGRNLLIELEKIPQISWDSNTLELILSGQKISNSSMNLLINKVVKQSSPTIPFGLVNFLKSALIHRIPLSYIRDADSLNIRQALIDTSKGVLTALDNNNIPETSSGISSEQAGSSVPDPEPSPELEPEPVPEPEPVVSQAGNGASEDGKRSLKRSREEEEEDEVGLGEDEDDGPSAKKQKTLDKSKRKKNPFAEKNLRRSRRTLKLKPELEPGWTSLGI